MTYRTISYNTNNNNNNKLGVFHKQGQDINEIWDKKGQLDTNGVGIIYAKKVKKN